jgi:hypothetical protein
MTEPTQNPLENLDLAGSRKGCASKSPSFLGGKVRDRRSMSEIDSMTMSAPTPE